MNSMTPTLATLVSNSVLALGALRVRVHCRALKGGNTGDVGHSAGITKQPPSGDRGCFAVASGPPEDEKDPTKSSAREYAALHTRWHVDQFARGESKKITSRTSRSAW